MNHPNCSIRMVDTITPILPSVSAKTCRNTPTSKIHKILKIKAHLIQFFTHSTNITGYLLSTRHCARGWYFQMIKPPHFHQGIHGIEVKIKTWATINNVVSFTTVQFAWEGFLEIIHVPTFDVTQIIYIKISEWGILWQSRSQDSAHSLSRAQVQSLVGELRSHKLHSTSKQINIRINIST